ncbi:MAG: TOBE domain-containing protein [bacterium]
MNLFATTLEASADGLAIVLGGERLRLPPPLAGDEALRAALGASVIAGIRPEDVRVTEGEGLAATVEHVENLGHETLVTRRWWRRTALPRAAPDRGTLRACARPRRGRVCAARARFVADPSLRTRRRRASRTSRASRAERARQVARRLAARGPGRHARDARRGAASAHRNAGNGWRARARRSGVHRLPAGSRTAAARHADRQHERQRARGVGFDSPRRWSRCPTGVGEDGMAIGGPALEGPWAASKGATRCPGVARESTSSPQASCSPRWLREPRRRRSRRSAAATGTPAARWRGRGSIGPSAGSWTPASASRGLLATPICVQLVISYWGTLAGVLFAAAAIGAIRRGRRRWWRWVRMGSWRSTRCRRTRRSCRHRVAAEGSRSRRSRRAAAPTASRWATTAR